MSWTMFALQSFGTPEPPDPPPPPEPPLVPYTAPRVGIHAVAALLDATDVDFKRVQQACGWQCKGCKATHAPNVFRCIWCRMYRTEDSPSLYKQGDANKLPSQIQAEMYAKQAEINAAWLNSTMGNKR